VSTQLRLVEPPAPAPRTGKQPRKATRTVGRRRRAVQWGEWRLDARTRSVGRAGIAAARQALEEAQASEQLSQAS
jgi:hypothetical protein